MGDQCRASCNCGAAERRCEIVSKAIEVERFDRCAWFVPDPASALVGWLEGRPTESQHRSSVIRLRRDRAKWKPDPMAWDQLVHVQKFVGHRVRVLFWHPWMSVLNEEDWPSPVEGYCEGVVTLLDNGHLQAFLILNVRGQSATTSTDGARDCFRNRAVVNGSLAPLAEIYEIQAIKGAV